MNTWKQENCNSVTYFVSNIKLIAQVWDFALVDAFSVAGEFNAIYIHMC